MKRWVFGPSPSYVALGVAVGVAAFKEDCAGLGLKSPTMQAPDEKFGGLFTCLPTCPKDVL